MEKLRQFHISRKLILGFFLGSVFVQLFFLENSLAFIWYVNILLFGIIIRSYRLNAQFISRILLTLVAAIPLFIFVGIENMAEKLAIWVEILVVVLSLKALKDGMVENVA